MSTKKITFPYSYSKNGRVGTIYRLGDGRYKTYFTYAHHPRVKLCTLLDDALAHLDSEFDKLDSLLFCEGLL